MKKFYLTTAIAYTSSKPHIGNVYEAILADSIVRYKKKDGFDTYFQTGTDEHGQKIQQKAESLGITPKELVDQVSGEIKKTYKLMNVEYDHFIRTTDKPHEIEVQKAFERLYKKGDIYKGMYEGHYCVACESYFTEKDLVNGCCPDCGAKVQLTKEECYFLRLEPYQKRLLEYIDSNPEFIQPESRKNEMINNFLSKPLPDLCVSRTSYTWGIPVSFDPKHVIYVWIDALMNYITGIDYHMEKSGENYNKYWPADVHLIGKDILRFHTIYWPIMLMALDLPLPKQVFGHPWILMNHGKMSKSKGNVIYADDLVELFGVDAVRYYVLHEIPFAQDGNITYELVCEKSNSDLANTYGNLVNRTLAMVKKYFKEEPIVQNESTEFDSALQNLAGETVKNYKESMDRFKVSEGIEAVMKLLRASNKYIDDTAPWVLAKEEAKKNVLMNVLYHLLEMIRISAILLEPIMPQTSVKVYNGLNTECTDFTDLSFGKHKSYSVCGCEVLFKRLDVEEVMKIVEQKENKPIKEHKPLIDITDFDKLDLVVGKIVEADYHPKADKLLVFKVDLQDEQRQIVSGIAKQYNPKDLIGYKVIVVRNLKPIVLRGIESYGMLLCASNENGENLELIQIQKADIGDSVR